MEPSLQEAYKDNPIFFVPITQKLQPMNNFFLVFNIDIKRLVT